MYVWHRQLLKIKSRHVPRMPLLELVDALEDAGFTTVASCRLLGYAELKELGMVSLAHRRVVLERIASLLNPLKGGPATPNIAGTFTTHSQCSGQRECASSLDIKQSRPTIMVLPGC